MANATKVSAGNLMARTFGDEEYALISTLLSKIIAIVSLSMLLSQFAFWWMGRAAGLGVVILILNIASNISISFLIKTNPHAALKLEVIRIAGLNQIAAMAAMYLIRGPLQPYWCIYMINALAIGPALVDLMTRRSRILCQALNIGLFLAFCISGLEPSMRSFEAAKIGMMLFLAGGMSEVYLSMVHQVFERLVLNQERLRSKQLELERKERFIQNFIDHFPGLAFAKSVGPESTFVLCNRAAREIIGEDVLGKSEMDLRKQISFVGDFVNDAADVKSNSKVQHAILQIENDSSHYYATTKFQVDDEGGQVSDCVIAVDVSESVRAQREMDTNRAKMIAASKMSSLGEMAGGVAHEINNPLAIIQGKAQQLGEFAKSENLEPAFVAKSAEKIMATVDRIARIVKALRSFSRDVAGTEPVATRAKDIVEDTLELCAERFRAHQISLEATPVSEHLTLECRSVEVCQILLNLLNNAHDAVENTEGGWVKIEARELPHAIEFRVTDSGAGVPLEIEEKILQPFFTTKAIGKGTGLGLSISLGLIESHEGSLKIDRSSPNTCFVATLPKLSRRALPAGAVDAAA